MRRTYVTVAVAILLGPAALLAQRPDAAKYLAPFVPSPPPVVDKMLEAAHIRPGETVYDLGCGDGRILITAALRYGARGVGIELSQKLVNQATERIRQLGLEQSIHVLQGDLLQADVSEADVVTLYLETLSNDRLRPKFEQTLKPGARVVSYEFPVRGWKPVHVEKIEAYNRSHNIYVYKVPNRK